MLVSGEPVSHPGADRGMVFQSYALYPHMNLYDNMAFGLKLAKVPKTEIDQAVAAAPVDAPEIQTLRAERDSLTKEWPTAIPGNSTAFSTESGSKLEGQYALIDADQLVTSHDTNLRANTAAAAPGFPGTSPLNSADIDLTSSAPNLNGRATPDYAVADTFKFVTGDIVADSNFDATGDPNPSDSQIYTVSYIANVPGSQPAGTYTTTLTYICTATF